MMAKKKTVSPKGAKKTSAPKNAPALPKMDKPAAPDNVVPIRKPQREPQIEVDPKRLAQLAKKLGDEVVGALEDMSHEELCEHLVSLAQHEEETQQALDRDPDVNDLKTQLKDTQGPYKDTLRGIKLRRQLAVLILQQRGRPVPQAEAK